MVINIKASNCFLFYRLPFSLKLVATVFDEVVFVEIVFVGVDFVGTVFFISIILSPLITELLIILTEYLLFSQVHALGFQIYFFSHDVLWIFTLIPEIMVIPLLI